MSAQLVINDHVIDLPDEVTYNFQVGDIGEISLSKSTYTTTFNIGRTSEVVELFKGLGLPGDRSNVPYTINNVMLMDDYAPLMLGTLVVLKTDQDYYNVSVISGAFDFFSEIGETKFSDLNLTEVMHDKTLSHVASRIDGILLDPYGGHYTYAMAHFGGNSHAALTDPVTGDEIEGTVFVNIDALVPLVTAKYLWDKIFESFPNFSFSGDFYTSQDFRSLWVGVPYPSFDEAGEPVKKAEIYKRNYSFSTYPDLPPLGVTYVSTDFVELEAPPSQQRVYAVSSGLARIDIDKFHYSLTTPENTNMRVVLWKNGDEVVGKWEGSRDGDLENIGTIDMWLNSGEFIVLTLEWDGGGITAVGEIHDLTVSISKITSTDTTKDKVFGLQVKTFVKEIMWRYGLVAIVNNGHLNFVSYSDIIDSSKVVDWSSKYAGRVSEEYSIGYAQNNWLKHRYDGEAEEFNDKNIRVVNENQAITKTLMQSEFYSPDEEKINFRTSPYHYIGVNRFPVFSNEKIQSRYFFARVNTHNYPYRLGSMSMGGIVEKAIGSTSFPNSLHVASFDDLSFRENTYYDSIESVVDNTRAHRIYLLLTAADISGLDLTAVYYFDQEQSLYTLNSLRYTKGELAQGEFIKIN